MCVPGSRAALQPLVPATHGAGGSGARLPRLPPPGLPAPSQGAHCASTTPHPRLIPITGSGCGRKMLRGGVGQHPRAALFSECCHPGPRPGRVAPSLCPHHGAMTPTLSSQTERPGGVGAGEKWSQSRRDPRSTPDPEVPPREAIRWDTPSCPLTPTECASSSNHPGSGCWRLAWVPRHGPWDASLDKRFLS